MSSATETASTSNLPAGPAAAAKAAVEAAIAETPGVSALASSASEQQNSESSEAQESQSSERPPLGGGAEGEGDSIRTVFQDPENFNVKHPLFHEWTLWFDNPSQKGMANARGSKDSWGEDLNKVVTFDSVEEFWGLYNNVIPPSELPQKANYYLFKEGVKPAWEDPANTNGGKWSIQLPRDKNRAHIDKLWLFTMLSAIGETFEAPSGVPPPTTSPENDLITGVIMSARANFYRISIWTRRADDDDETTERLMEIGKHFKTSVLGYDLNQKVGGGLTSDVEFQSHKESEKKKGKKIVV